MYDKTLIEEKFEQIKAALLKIQKRFDGISKPDDFLFNDSNLDKLDAISMMLIAIGESFKKIDKETNGKLLVHYLKIDWKGGGSMSQAILFSIRSDV
ncbi:MAG: antitoxin [Athalassotoga sp.]|uniref:antitoxin n=1 Tax=Athalassotoga sp. TaxID=2022597 RepID=UPI003CFCF57B